VKTSFDTVGTALITQANAFGVVATNLGTSFDGAFGATGRVYQAISNLAPNTTNALAIMTQIANGATRDAITVAHPYESLVYAQEIATLLALSPDEKHNALTALISSLTSGTPLREQLELVPELMEYTDLAYVDKLVKTGMFPS
jgi:hypothetical protein